MNFPSIGQYRAKGEINLKKIFIEKQLLEKVYQELKNQKKVAKYFNVSLKVIKRLCKEYELQTFEHRKHIDFDKDYLIELYKTHTQSEMADKLDISLTTLRHLLSTYQIKSDKSSVAFYQLSHSERDVIIGSILGDGYIAHKCLNISHSIKQEQYLRYKMDLLKKVSSRKIYTREFKTYQSLRFRTYALSELDELRLKFYKDTTKIIPKDIQEYLTPLSVAIWYMDDGGIRGKSAGRIATCSFSQSEVALLSKSLNTVFNINTRVIKETKYYNIYIPSRDKSFENFCSIIRPYMHESMAYKLIKLKCND